MDGAVEDFEDASAAAMGSPHSVSAWVGNPPSRETKSPGGGEATLRKILAGLSGPTEIDEGDTALIAAGLPVDRLSLCVDDEAPAEPERLLSFWRPFRCPDLGTGATSESGPVDRSLRIDEAVVRTLAALFVSYVAWYCPGTGDWAPVEPSPLVEEVGVQAGLRGYADWRCRGAGDWALVGASLAVVATERMLAAPRALPDRASGAASSPDSDGATLDRALTLGVVGGAPHVGCWRLAEAVVRGILPFFLLVVLFEPVADLEEPLGRLTLGGVSSSAHSCSRSSQSSEAATLPDGGRGGEGGREEPAAEPVQGVCTRQVFVPSNGH